MAKPKKKWNAALCVTPYIINSLLKVYVIVKIIQIWNNPLVKGMLALGNAFEVKFSFEDISKLIEQLLRWNLIPSEFKAMVFVHIAVGIYGIVLFWGLCKDINVVCAQYEGGNGKPSPNYLIVLLLSIPTLGIYYLYWVYKQGNRLWRADQNYYRTGSKDKGIIYLLLVLFGGITCGITTCIFAAMLINNINRLWESGQSMGNQNIASPIMQRAAEKYSVDEDALTVPVNDLGQGMNMRKGCLECCAGIYQGALFEIEEGEELMIGRDETTAHIVIKNPKISRKHCGIRFQSIDGTYLVTDYSFNGTFYKNGQRFEANRQTCCQPGTIVVIAQSGNEFLLK